jgi:cyanophycinase
MFDKEETASDWRDPAMTHTIVRCALAGVLFVVLHRFPLTAPASAGEPVTTSAAPEAGAAGVARAADSREVNLRQANMFGLPAKAIESKGSLVVAGGGRTPNEVYDEFVRLAGGERARIVLIPSACDWEGLDQIRRRFYGWLSYRVADFRFLDTDSRDTANTDSFVKPLLEATGVWFSGGDQSRLTRRYAGTKVEAALQRVLERGGVVGGISAGAAVQSEVMLRDGDTEPVIGQGLGLASHAVIDTHFSERGRHTRLLRVLDERPGLVGVGLDEGAALVVQGSRLRAIGRSTVTVCVGAEDNQPMLLHRLKAGEEAELVPAEKAGEVRPAPIALKRRGKKVPSQPGRPPDAHALTSSPSP